MNKNLAQFKLLLGCFPYRCIERTVLLSAVESDEKRAYFVNILSDMEKRGYVEKRVIYRKGSTGIYQSVKPDSSTSYQKRVGCVIVRLTALGVLRLIDLCSMQGVAVPQLLRNFPIQVTADTPWGDRLGKADSGNRNRKLQAINNMLRAVSVRTTLDARINYRQARQATDTHPPQAKTICDAIAKQLYELSSLQPNQLPYTPSDLGCYFERDTISSKKKFHLDNMIGIVVTATHALSIYHTGGYWGTTWVASMKQENDLEIQSFLHRIGVGQRNTKTALMFTSTVKEFADIITTCHAESTNVTKYFSGYKEAKELELGNIGEPYAKLNLIPEEREAYRQLKAILLGAENGFWESEFGEALSKSIPDAIYNETLLLVENGIDRGIEPVFHFPNDTLNKEYFLKGSFPFSVVLSSAQDAPVIPVLLGYEMDLITISRAYYWYKKTSIIGTVAFNGQERRALLIACYKWQIRWYAKLFPDAIYFENNR